MTDTEAKALALVNEHALNRRDDLLDAKTSELHCALLDVVQVQEATEARHAAEMRELKGRFGEAVERVLTVTDRRQETHAWRVLSPFILPTPDPIETACRELGIDRDELARRGVKLSLTEEK